MFFVVGERIFINNRGLGAGFASVGCTVDMDCKRRELRGLEEEKRVLLAKLKKLDERIEHISRLSRQLWGLNWLKKQ